MVYIDMHIMLEDHLKEMTEKSFLLYHEARCVFLQRSPIHTARFSSGRKSCLDLVVIAISDSEKKGLSRTQ